MPGTHVDLEQQEIVVGLGRAQPGGPFCRLPIGHARIVQSAGDQHRRIILRLDIVIGRVAPDQVERRLVLDRIAPLGPFAGRQRQVTIEHGAQHVDKRHIGDDRAPQLGRLVGHRPHQLAPGRPALRRDPAFRGIAKLDQPARNIDEIVERVGPPGQLPVEIPAVAKVIPAANMRNGIGEAAVDQAQPARRETRRDRQPVCAIAVEE